MNGMKKLLWATIALLVAACVFALILNITKNDLKNQISENSQKAKTSESVSAESEKNEQEYVFFTYSINLSRDKDINVGLIDSKGLKYELWLTGYDKLLSPEEALSKTLEKNKNNTGTEFLREKDMENLCELINNIDPKMEFTSEENGKGNGTFTLYGIVYKSGKPSLVKIYSSGDTEEIPIDGNAVIVQKYYKKKLNESEVSSIV